MRAVFVSEQELIAVASHYGLSSRKDWLKNAMRALWDRDHYIVPETADLYPYLMRSGMGVEVEVSFLGSGK